jgi:uncharacterized repeat protein (TIGR03803 family)
MKHILRNTSSNGAVVSGSRLKLSIVIRYGLLLVAGILLSSSSAAAQTVTTLYDFKLTNDGQNPQAGVVFDRAGILYGAAALGAKGGIVFSLTPPAGGGDGPWTETVLHGFQGTPDGKTPASDLVITSNGSLFGTTLEGGDHNMGTVFALIPPKQNGGFWKERVLYSFGSTPKDGVLPNTGLLQAKDGFFGVTSSGGANGRGAVYQLTPPDGKDEQWTETIIYNFAGSGDAAFPLSSLISDQDGNLYGTTLQGGVNNVGAAYQLTPPKQRGESWKESVIYSFAGPDGSSPAGRFQLAEHGVLYGTTDGGGLRQEGTVFQLTPPQRSGDPWTQTVLYNFSGGRDGGNPVSGVILDRQGRLFGMASTGGNGPRSGGVLFRLDPPANQGDPWTEIVLHSFGGPDGFRSLSRLIRRNGLMYGTTSAGGQNGVGNVFVLRQ